MQTYAISAKNACAAANAGAVKNLSTPVIRIVQHAPELSVMTVENVVSATKTAVVRHVHVVAVQCVMEIVIVVSRHVHAMIAHIHQHAIVQRIMVLIRKPLG